MKAILHKCPKDWKEVHLYLLADWHWGSRQCRKAEIRKLVKRIADDPKALWLGCGDMMENALISSVGDIYKQEVSPQSQLGQLVLLLEPIADKCLAMVSGNHGQRTSKCAGLDPDHILAALLKLSDLEDWGVYCGASAMINLMMGDNRAGDSDTRWSIYLHHGVGGGRTKGGKVNAAARGPEIVEGMDLFITAHHHADNAFSDRVARLAQKGGNCSVLWRSRHYTSCLSALGYSGSYAEAKQMPPAAVGQVMLTLGARVHHKHNDPEEFIKPYKREVIWF